MTLRARLFAAILVVALLSLALALAIGALLTRRAVERNTLKDVSAQLDLLVERERDALLPFSPATLGRCGRSSSSRTSGSCRCGSTAPPRCCRPRAPPASAAARRLQGTLDLEGTRYLYAARLFKRKGFVLLRPAESTNSAWRPHVRACSSRPRRPRCSPG